MNTAWLFRPRLHVKHNICRFSPWKGPQFNYLVVAVSTILYNILYAVRVKAVYSIQQYSSVAPKRPSSETHIFMSSLSFHKERRNTQTGQREGMHLTGKCRIQQFQQIRPEGWGVSLHIYSTVTNFVSVNTTFQVVVTCLFLRKSMYFFTILYYLWRNCTETKAKVVVAEFENGPAVPLCCETTTFALVSCLRGWLPYVHLLLWR
jgi:hypothetical protein